MKSPLMDLFLTFAKIGAFTFGGGYAMIPLIQREAAENKHWVSDQDILDIVAIAESTPGPIAINSATFIGRKVAGVRGAVCATLGVVLPSFVIIVALSYVIEAFQHLRPVEYAFIGIRAGVLALMLKSLWKMYKQVDKNVFSWVVMAAAFAVVTFLRVDAILVIAASALAGILWTQLRKGAKA